MKDLSSCEKRMQYFAGRGVSRHGTKIIGWSFSFRPDGVAKNED